MAHPQPRPAGHPTDRILGQAPAMADLRATIRHLAPFDALGSALVPSVVLQGETGTGKGLVARVIHDSGPRAHGPCIEVNCAAIPETLLEAELFGFAAGAFTDARHAKPGLFEAASGGTLFLDEIDALPLPLQAKLLQAIEQRWVRRLGAVAEHPVDVKLIAATPSELGARVAQGHFRADLYHRLAVVVLTLPPLRERGEDVRILAQEFLQHSAAGHGLAPPRLRRAAEAWLGAYSWPGNVRELSHLLERVTLFHPGAIIDAQTLEQLCLPRGQPAARGEAEAAHGAQEPLDEAGRIRQALLQTRGNVVQAAWLLGLSRKALRYRMGRYGIERLPRGATSPQATAASACLTRQATPRIAGEPQREAHSWPTQESGKGVRAGARRAKAQTRAREVPALTPAWEQKAVAVLAVHLTFPTVAVLETSAYEPWTVTARWQQALAETIRGFGGVLLPGIHPLLVAAFGIPHALERMPQRAVQAALVIRRMVAEATPRAGQEPCPEARLAAHLGTMLVDVQASNPAAHILALGDTLALPVRLVGHAAPGEILVSPDVGRTLAGWYELEARKVLEGGGTEGQTRAYAVVGLVQRRSPLAMLAARPQSLFVGRERELATLHDLLDQVEQGHGQAVGIVGEPGLGKSRLLAEFRQSLRGRSVTYLEGHCLPYGSLISYLPVLDLLRDTCGITELDGPETVVEKVRQSLQDVGMDPEAGAPYLLQLLGVQAGTERLATLDPTAIKARTFETLRQMSLLVSQQQACIFAVEDLQWIDETSAGFFASLVEHIAGVPILFLTTYRPGYQPAWLTKSYATQIALPPLASQDSLRLLQAILHIEHTPRPLADVILPKVEGNPFFLEEIVQALVEHGMLVREAAGRTQQAMLQLQRPLTEIQLPPAVQGVLAARIDRLPPEQKRLLQCAAVIGKDVPFPLLQAIAELPEDGLRSGLAHLQAAEFLYETRLFPALEYSFKHALTQEVAYGSLLQERRCALHRRIVEAIEALYRTRLTEQVERLTYHASQGEAWDKAVTYGHQAGARAADRAAFREAATYFEQSLVALGHLPETPDTRGLTIDLRLDLARRTLHPLGEWERSLPLLREATVLARDDRARLARTLAELAAVLRARADLAGAMTAGQQALALATALGDVALQMEASFPLALAYHDSGDYERAVELLRRNMAALEAGTARPGDSDYSIRARAWLARALSAFGQFTEGRRYGEEALHCATEEGRGDALIVACGGLGYLYLIKGDLEAAMRLLDRAVALSRAADDKAWARRVAALLGYASALAGHLAEGCTLLEEACSTGLRIGELIHRSRNVVWLSAVCLLAGRVDQARQYAHQALALARQHGTHGYEALALCQLGDIHAHADPPDTVQAEARYREARAGRDARHAPTGGPLPPRSGHALCQDRPARAGRR